MRSIIIINVHKYDDIFTKCYLHLILIIRNIAKLYMKMYIKKRILRIILNRENIKLLLKYLMEYNFFSFSIIEFTFYKESTPEKSSIYSTNIFTILSLANSLISTNSPSRHLHSKLRNPNPICTRLGIYEIVEMHRVPPRTTTRRPRVLQLNTTSLTQ